MKTYGFLYEEKLTYHKELKIETDLTENELLDVVERAERNAGTFEDIAFEVIEHPRIKLLDGIDSDYSSPLEMEVEYFDHRVIKEEDKWINYKKH